MEFPFLPEKKKGDFFLDGKGLLSISQLTGVEYS
jgi:hypothetical protein